MFGISMSGSAAGTVEIVTNKTMKFCFHGAPIIVGERKQRRKVSDNKVYVKKLSRTPG